MKTKQEEAVLFPEVEIANIKVKPWSFGKLFDISDSLETIIDKVEEKKIDESLLKDEVNILDIAKLFTIARKEVLRIICITVDKDEKEIRDLSIEDGVKLAYVIFTQNRDAIKNAFTPLLQTLSQRDEEGVS